MSRLIKSRAKKAGLPPGSLVYVGERQSSKSTISVFDYSSTALEEKQLARAADCAAYKSRPTTSWINVDGISDVGVVEQIGRDFAIHPLVLEDILNTTQRPKRLVYGDYIYLVVKMLSLNGHAKVRTEQVSFVLGAGFLISFQEEDEHDVFDRVRESIRKNTGPVRSQGADYLAYALIDAIVDHHFTLLEALGERLEKLEERVVESPDERVVREIYRVKRDLLLMRRSVWPLREVIGALERGESPLVKASTLLYLRDVHDHIIEIIEIMEMFRDMASGLLDIYLSSINNRINNVMKILAMVATIFMPLTLIAGIYGMNFDYLPELHWSYGYPLVMGVMVLISAVMLLYYKRKGWL